MFGTSSLKAVQLENAELKTQIMKLQELVERLTERMDELPMVIESQVDDAVRNIDLSDEIEHAVSDIMRNATVSIDF